MKIFYVTARDQRKINKFGAYEGGAELVKFDWSAWAEENGALTSVTWAVQDGSAAISSETLSSSVAQAKVTTSQRGWSLVKLTAASASATDIQYFRVLCSKPNQFIDDYGMCA